MATQIQLRRDTAANWTSSNPVLAQAEPGYETDTGKIKYGDGSTAWNSLAYAESDQQFSSGSASSPSITFTGDTNTGIYSPGADQLALSTSGVGRVFVDASGRVGINNSNLLPFGKQLLVNGSGGFNNDSGTVGIGFSKGSSSTIGYIGTGDWAVNGAATTDFGFATGGNLLFSTGTGFNEKMRLDSSGRLGIGTTDARGVLRLAGSSANAFPNNGGLLWLTDTNAATDYKNWSVSSINGDFGVARASDAFNTAQNAYKITGSATQGYVGEHIWYTNNSSEKVRIDNSGRLLVGTSSAPTGGTYALNSLVSVKGFAGSSTGVGILNVSGGMAATSVVSGTEIAVIACSDTAGNEYATIKCVGDGTGANNDYPGRLVFSTTADGASSPTQRMKIGNSGHTWLNSSDFTTLYPGEGNTATGFFVESDGKVAISRNNTNPLVVNRNTSDGTLVDLRQDGISEGSISVSGTTVFYNGAHLSRWSQLPGGVERTEILRGTVLSNIDEMCEWGEEDNEQLNRMKVSDVEGDKNVSGVFQGWDDDDDTYVNDFYCAMTGDFIIRIAEGITVERGDLLMSAGDGTAKPQEDDIIRSKTIAKVTSTNVSCTYDDGSYCVPCVLMAC